MIDVKKINLRNISRTILGVLLLCVFLFSVYFSLKQSGFLDNFKTKDDFMAFLSKYNAYAVLVYIFIQFLQVTILPIPAFITTIAGVFLFGAPLTILYSLVAIIPASMLAFGFGRWFGKPFVSWMVGKETMNKWLDKTAGKEKTVFFTMFILPMFPDDTLCMVAGLSKMSWLFFFIMNLITRPIGVVCTCFFMGGQLIPYDTAWGIALYVIIIILCLGAVICSWLYSEQIQNFLLNLSQKIKNKVKKKSN